MWLAPSGEMSIQDMKPEGFSLSVCSWQLNYVPTNSKSSLKYVSIKHTNWTSEVLQIKLQILH